VNARVGNVLAIQTYGWILRKDDNSSGARGSRARVDFAVSLIEKNIIPRENLVVVFPQGWPNDEKRIGNSLGEQVGAYFSSRPGMENIQVIYSYHSWGTESDVKNTPGLANRAGYREGKIYFVSDPVHIKRVRQIWKYYHVSGWSAEFFGATNHTLSFFERRIREPIARFVFWFKTC
jgi:hypothetical protein